MLNQRGFSPVLIIFLILLLILVSLGLIFVVKPNNLTISLIQNKTTPNISNINNDGGPESSKSQTYSNFNIKTTKLANMLPGSKSSAVSDDFIFDPNGKRVAYIHNTDEGMQVVENDKPGKTYAEVRDLTFSPDGNHLAYVATLDKNYPPSKSFVVLDGQEQKQYEVIKNLVFSPDSKTLAYAAGNGVYFFAASQFDGYRQAKELFMVIGTKEGKPYDGAIPIDNPNLSPYYMAVFSSDSKSVAYKALKNGKSIIVFNDQEIEKYPYEEHPYFVLGTNELGYTAHMTQDDWNYSKNTLHVVGNTEYKQGKPIFNQKGNVIGFLEGKYGSYYLNVNNKVGNKFNNIYNIATNANDQIAFNANQDVIGAPDSKAGSLSPVVGIRRFVVVNNTILDDETTSASYYSQPVFSPDGENVAYLIAYIGGGTGRLILYDGQKAKLLESIYGDLPKLPKGITSNDVVPPVFSPDGQFIGFGVKKANNQFWWHAVKVNN